VAALILAAAAAQGAEPPAPFELRAEGSFPVQYTETATSKSNSHTLSVAPYLGLIATAHLQPDLTTSVFANGGHSQLGSFAENDNTFVSAGANLVKHWGAWRVGASFEHTHYFDGVFGDTTTVANDVNVFASYLWQPNPDLHIRPSATATMRLDEALAVQRYSYGGRIDIEQRLFDQWWLVAASRLRFSDYVGAETGRRDTRFAVVSGLKYAINESVAARLLAGYENRMSNIASRRADKFTIGASIDFDIDFMRPRWPGGR
jgi:hypothetical protein